MGTNVLNAYKKTEQSSKTQKKTEDQKHTVNIYIEWFTLTQAQGTSQTIPTGKQNEMNENMNDEGKRNNCHQHIEYEYNNNNLENKSTHSVLSQSDK